MCLAVPMKLLQMEGTNGTVEIGGINHVIDISLVPQAQEGDYLIVHAGFALNVLDEEDAMKTLALFDEMKEKIGDQPLVNR